MPGLPEGKYAAKLTVFGKGGAVLREARSEFEKQDPAKKFKWWNTAAGNSEKVIPPWTPVKVKGLEIAVWGRTMPCPPGTALQTRANGR